MPLTRLDIAGYRSVRQLHLELDARKPVRLRVTVDLDGGRTKVPTALAWA